MHWSIHAFRARPHAPGSSTNRFGRSRPLRPVRSVPAVRNRPDSRPRLTPLRLGRLGTPAPAGLTERTSAASSVRPTAVVGGWTPEPADFDLSEALLDRPDRTEDRDDVDDPEEVDDEPIQSVPATSRRPEPRAGAHAARRVRSSRRHPWGRLAKRWVPEPLRDSRVDPGRRGALLLTVVAAVAALVAAFGVWRDRPEPQPVQAVSLAQVTDTAAAGPTRGPASSRPSGGTPAPGVMSGGLVAVDSSGGRADTTGSPSPSPAAIVVSVTGAVHHPGLVRLTTGSRVADAIAKAGGATEKADLTGLNLAQKLTDGASVVVAGAGAAAPTGSGSSVSGTDADVGPAGQIPTAAGGKLDLNTTDVAGLDALPGVGPVTAAGIVAWREKNGRFTSVQQLQEIPGIGPAKYAALSPLVKV